MTKPGPWLVAQTFALCCAGSILLGFAVFGDLIFHKEQVFFQFVASGIIGGLFVASIGRLRPKTMLVLVLVTAILMVLVARSDTTMLLLRDVIWVFGLFGAVKMGIFSNRLFPRLVVGKFVVWSAAFALVHFSMLALLSLINATPLDQGLALLSTRMGALIGAGVGLGYEVSEFASTRVWRLSGN